MAVAYLEEKGAAFEIVEYLKEVPTKDALKKVLAQLEMNAFDLIRKNEAVFKEQFKGKEHTDDEWIDIMIAHPKLIERPIVILENKAVVARPTERIDTLLSK